MDINKILEMLESPENIDLKLLDEVSYEYAKRHNPEMEEAVAKAYRDGVRDAIVALHKQNKI